MFFFNAIRTIRADDCKCWLTNSAVKCDANPGWEFLFLFLFHKELKNLEKLENVDLLLYNEN